MQETDGFHAVMIQLRQIEPRDRDWLVERHIALYRAECGFDDSFGVLVGEIVDAFIANFDPVCEAAWIADLDSTPVGSIFCVRLDPETAQLRLFFLEPDARGQGIGHLLLRTCMTFAQDCGYLGMRLWTHRSHAAACALYRRAGWTLIESEPAVSFGQAEVIETYVYRF